VGAIPGVASFLIPFRNAKGEDGIVVPMCLPGPAMDTFVRELGKLLSPPAEQQQQQDAYTAIRSAL